MNALIQSLILGTVTEKRITTAFDRFCPIKVNAFRFTSEA